MRILIAEDDAIVADVATRRRSVRMGRGSSANAIEVYVHRLRRKLESGGVKIGTVRGLGYCIDKAPSNAPIPSPS